MVDGATVNLADTVAEPAEAPKIIERIIPNTASRLKAWTFPWLVWWVISLVNGALLGAALGPCQGKGTGEHGLFQELHEVFVTGNLNH